MPIAGIDVSKAKFNACLDGKDTRPSMERPASPVLPLIMHLLPITTTPGKGKSGLQSRLRMYRFGKCIEFPDLYIATGYEIG